MLEVYDEHTGSGEELAKQLDTELVNPKRFTQGDSSLEGEDVIRAVRARRNQNVFRRMISDIYRGECCISGLDIPELNRASHIVPWSEDKGARLDPSNGLFLSATYDAAFDRNLITLDEDYRVVVSRQVREHYSNAAVSNYFKKVEGAVIRLPEKYLPCEKYLEKHRVRLI